MGKNRRASFAIPFGTPGEATITGVNFDEHGNLVPDNTGKNPIEARYNEFKGVNGDASPSETSSIDIKKLADGVKNIANKNWYIDDEDLTAITDEMYNFDKTFGVETYWEPYENQVFNKINRIIQKEGSITSEQVIDSLTESYIYQYNKEYKNKPDVNKFLRHQFKEDMLKMMEE